MIAEVRGDEDDHTDRPCQVRKAALEALRTGKRGRKLSKTEEQLKTEIARLRAVVVKLSAETLQLKKRLWPYGHIAATPRQRNSCSWTRSSARRPSATIP